MSTLILRSNNLHDIHASVNLGGWTHTFVSRRAKKGDTLVVFGNSAVCREAGVDFKKQLALVGRLKEDPYRLDKGDERFPSNKIESIKNYIGRYDLEFMDLIPLDVIPGAMHNIMLRNHTHFSGGAFY